VDELGFRFARDRSSVRKSSSAYETPEIRLHGVEHRNSDDHGRIVWMLIVWYALGSEKGKAALDSWQGAYECLREEWSAERMRGSRSSGLSPSWLASCPMVSAHFGSTERVKYLLVATH
jgi:hypothetical protein